MFVKSLTKAAFILGLGVVAGCDDPEVQSKVADTVQYGIVLGELECSYYDPMTYADHIHIGDNKFSYKASKLIDGSCYATFCSYFVNQDFQGPTSNSCLSSFSGRDTGGNCKVVIPKDQFTDTSTYPRRIFQDGIFGHVEDGLWSIGIDDHKLTTNTNCGSSQFPVSCIGPQTWHTIDITGPECTGRNLEAFGATP
jgi:hypothetical protein